MVQIRIHILGVHHSNRMCVRGIYQKLLWRQSGGKSVIVSIVLFIHSSHHEDPKSLYVYITHQLILALWQTDLLSGRREPLLE